MHLVEQTLNSKTAYSGKIFTIKTDTVALPNKKTATRELALKQNATCVIAITKSKKIILVNQYRYAVKRCLWEVPAGKMDSNETPLHCAKRELLEETGFKSNNWTKIGLTAPCPGFCNELIHMFFAKNAFKVCEPKPDPDEFVETRLFDFNELVQQAAYGQIIDSKTTCSILRTHFLILNNTLQI